MIENLKIIGAILFLALCISFLAFQIRQLPSDDEVRALFVRKGCKPTNDFVGRYGERLFLCTDGLKYKYDDIRSLAQAAKR